MTSLVLEVEVDTRTVAVSAPQTTVEAAVGTPTAVDVAGANPEVVFDEQDELVLEVEVNTRAIAVSAPQATVEAAVGTPTTVDVTGAGPVVVFAASAGPQGEPGEQGEPGAPGLVPRGAWDPAATYLPGDVATRSGSAWLALSESTGVDPNSVSDTIVGSLISPSPLFFSSAVYSVATSFTVDRDCAVTALDLSGVFAGVTPGGTAGLASAPNNAPDTGVPWLGSGTPDGEAQVALDNEVILHVGMTYWLVLYLPNTGGLKIDQAGDLVGSHMAPAGEFLYGTAEPVTYLNEYGLPVKLLGSLLGQAAWTLFVQGAS